MVIDPHSTYRFWESGIPLPFPSKERISLREYLFILIVSLFHLEGESPSSIGERVLPPLNKQTFVNEQT